MKTIHAAVAGCALTGMLALCAAPALAQAPTDAKAILDKSSEFAKSLKTVYGDMVSTITAGGQTINNRTQIWVEVPDKMHTRSTNPDGTLVAIYVNGTQQTTFIQKMNQYATTQVPQGTAGKMLYDSTVGGLLEGGGVGGKSGPPQVTLVGKETLGGVATVHLRVTPQTGGTADVWIADSAQPLPVFIKMSQAQPPMSSETYCRWVVDKAIPASTFQFTPPPGATDMMAGRPAAGAVPATR